MNGNGAQLHNEMVADKERKGSKATSRISDATGELMTPGRIERAHKVETDPADNPVLYNVKASIKQIETWKDVKQGYLSLFSYLVFVLLFITILVLQLNVPLSYTIDYALREVLVEQSEGLEVVRSMDQVWDYLIGPEGSEESGLIGKIFQESWYNDEPFGPSDQGFVLGHNKLVGGALLVQERGKAVPCDPSSVYAQLYPTCYTDEVDKAAFGPADGSGAGRFRYREEWGGHGAFLSLSAGREENLAAAAELKQRLWLDKHSRLLHLKFAVYNGNLEIFTYVDVQFAFGQGGGLRRPHRVNIQSVKLELYASATDWVRLVMELGFVAYVGYQLGTEMNELLTVAAQGRPGDYLSDAWNILDCLNIGLFSLSILWRVRYVYTVSADTLEVPTDEYKMILEEAANLQTFQVSINSFNILICIFRMFKFYEFQDRLNILTRTFGQAWTDLYHFLIMFLVIFFGYAFLSHVIWGAHIYTYSTFAFAIQSQWEMLLGNYDYVALQKVAPDFAAILFWTYTFFVAIVCLNVLLAILIEAFSSASEPDDPHIPPNSVAEQLKLAVERALKEGSREPSEKELSDEALARVLHNFASDGIVAVSEEDIAARLDFGMQAQLQRKLPILKPLDPALLESAEKDLAAEEAERKLELLQQSTRLLQENRRLKEELAFWTEGGPK